MRFTHRTTATVVLQTDSAPGLASPTAHLRRGVGRTAATSVPGLCFEWPPSHLSAVRVTRALRSNIHNQDRRVRPIVHTVVDVYRCHYRPPMRLGRASDGTDRAVPPSGPSASSSCRHMLQFAANERSALGRIHKRDASGEPRVSLTCFRSPPFNVPNFSTKTHFAAESVHLP